MNQIEKNIPKSTGKCISVIVEAKPMTSNKSWQGRKFRTRDYDSYEKEILYLLPWKEQMIGFIEINYTFGISYVTQGDVDNFIKPLNDILVKKGYIKDDRYVMRISAEKVVSDEPFIKIKIYPYENRN